MKGMSLRLLALACLLLCGVALHAQVPAPFVFPPYNDAPFLADLNGDGRPDLVTGSGTVFLANADGTFSQGATVSIGTNPSCTGNAKPCPIPFTVVALADVTGDGKADMLVSAQQTFLYVLPGNGDGTFGTPVTTNMGLTLGTVLVEDLNRDRNADIITAYQQGPHNGQLFVYLGNGDGTFRAGTQYTLFAGSNTNILQFATGDFNGDGKLDIVASGDTTNTIGAVGILPGNGDGTFGPAITSVGVQAGGRTNSGLGVADFNGDGKLDLIVPGYDPSSLTSQTYLFAGKGDGTFQSPTNVAPGAGPISVADMNGDGKHDFLVWASPFIEVLLGNGNGTFSRRVFADGNRGASLVSVADLNGDGNLDVTDGATVEFGNGDGTLRTLPAFLINVSA
jgi:FG-GAP-like repeat/FG-GAP repeat